MVAILVEGPAVEPVTREEAKVHARVDGPADDERIDDLIAAARAAVEARTGRALVAQRWRVVLDTVPASGVIRLAPAPVRTVERVTLPSGRDDGYEIVDECSYDVDVWSTPCRLLLTPAVRERARHGVSVDLTCGYGEPANVPRPLKHAILMLVMHWLERPDAAAARAMAGPVGASISALTAPYSLPRVA